MHNLISKLQRGRIAEALEVAEELAADLAAHLSKEVRKAANAERLFLKHGGASRLDDSIRHAISVNATIDTLLAAGFAEARIEAITLSASEEAGQHTEKEDAKARIDAIILSAREQEKQRPEKQDDKADD